jgi:hypothetical protein
MNAEARVAPGEKKVEALWSDELAVSKKPEDLVAEEQLRFVRVERREWVATSGPRGKPRG